jgi:hypothetical protein
MCVVCDVHTQKACVPSGLHVKTACTCLCLAHTAKILHNLASGNNTKRTHAHVCEQRQFLHTHTHTYTHMHIQMYTRSHATTNISRHTQTYANAYLHIQHNPIHTYTHGDIHKQVRTSISSSLRCSVDRLKIQEVRGGSVLVWLEILPVDDLPESESPTLTTGVYCVYIYVSVPVHLHFHVHVCIHFCVFDA